MRSASKSVDVIEAILGYLAVFLLRGGERLINRKFDDALDRLGRRAADELAGRGYGQELNELRKDPLDPSACRFVEEGLREAMGQEPAFAASLAWDAKYLDKRGGQRVIQYVVYG